MMDKIVNILRQFDNDPLHALDNRLSVCVIEKIYANLAFQKFSKAIFE